MRIAAMILMLGVAAASGAFAQPAEPSGPSNPPDLAPIPASTRFGQGRLLIGGSFSVAIEGSHDPILDRAARRFLGNLSRQTGIIFRSGAADSARAALVLHADRASRPVQDAVEEESYTLEVTTAGARITASAPLGVLHGLETLLQLVHVAPDGFAVPAVRIEDRPRFPWRGLLIDACRHFIPLGVLERNIDGMAAVKMNVLHLHLSDDQGFRVESKAFPLLQGLGSDGQFYTQDEIRALVAYARDRGVRVVPEFDMPGHSTSWFAGYPELASAPGPYEIERAWGVHDAAMDPTRESTYRFLDRLIGEMAALFPDPYFHIGGDEVNGKQWGANPEIQEFMRSRRLKTSAELQTYFTARVQKLVAKRRKIMIGWDEILTPGLPKESVVQSWHGQDFLAGTAKQGYRGFLSNGYYLDLMTPASELYLVDPLRDQASLTPDQQKLILGGEACMWGEFVSPENIDSRIWPRTVAVAERLWSPQGARDLDSMYRRLGRENERLQWLGLTRPSGDSAMLNRLAGSGDVEALRVLADAVEPVKLYARWDLAKNAGVVLTSDDPLNRLVDAASPESETVRRFSADVDAWKAGRFKDAAAEARLRSLLSAWRDNDARLEPVIESSFLLKETAPLSRNLAALGAAGLRALDDIDRGERAPNDWESRELALIERAKNPSADLLLTAAPAVQVLIEAAAGR